VIANSEDLPFGENGPASLLEDPMNGNNTLAILLTSNGVGLFKAVVAFLCAIFTSDLTYPNSLNKQSNN
jgi:hypothetical protein